MGQARRRGTYEQRVQQAQSQGLDKYPEAQAVELKRLTVCSPPKWTEAFAKYNTDYLRGYRARGLPPVHTYETAQQLVLQELPNWLSQPESAVLLAFNTAGQIVGYTTHHVGHAAAYHTDCTDALTEDIYVAPEFRHQGYMTAIRRASRTRQSLVDKFTLRRLIGYYQKVGFRSFSVSYYPLSTFPTPWPVMKPTLAVRYDLQGQFTLDLHNLDRVIQRETKELKKQLGPARYMEFTAEAQ
jgi:GNAT superfamily N-acetyltransferase